MSYFSVYYERKQLRLTEYDYSQEGAYFITFCTAYRSSFLAQISPSYQIEPPFFHTLLPCGQIVFDVLQKIPDRYSVTISDAVIMPDHVHFILWLQNTPDNPTQHRTELSKIIGYIKMNCSKQIHRLYPGTIIWQRDYYEHILHSYDEYLQYARYIAENPRKRFWKMHQQK